MDRHILGTYFALRAGIATLGVALPLALGLGGAWLHGLPLQGSLSAYYHAGGGVLRDVFVGCLCAVGAGLYFYKGFGARENWALNAAGVCAFGVAWRPMPWPETGGGLSLHGTFAVCFFLCIAFVAVKCNDETLPHLPDAGLRERFRRIYRGLAGAMVTLPFAAWGLASSSRQWRGSATFWVETAGIAAFSAYWVVKGYELHLSDAECLHLGLAPRRRAA